MNVPRPLAIVLWPLSLVYGFAARLRAWFYVHGWIAQKRLSKPVISVGNLTVGGTGKTPMVIWLAERFLADGKRVGILSRGYRGTGGTSDEIELMKRRLGERVLFGVGKDRYSEGQRLEAFGVDMFLLDDGFQHLQLARDADVVLIDSTRPLHREFVLPAGRLREPTSGLHRANLVVFTRTGPWLATARAIQRFPNLPIYPSGTRLLRFERFGSRGHGETGVSPSGPYFAFCGIGNPDVFFEDLGRWGVKLAGSRTFRDHHRYTRGDAERLEKEALATGATALITTEKDAQNISDASFLKLPLEVAIITIEIGDENEFMRHLRARLPAASGAAA